MSEEPRWRKWFKRLRNALLVLRGKPCYIAIDVCQHHVADAFWKHWREYGDTHTHGYYESTWGAIFAALDAAIDAEEGGGWLASSSASRLAQP
jgi:hypothetical protein